VNVLSGAPYGYRYVRKTQESAAYYEIIEDQAVVVRKVYAWYTSEGLSIAAVVRRLNEQGVPTRKRLSRWERSTVWAMLRNPAYKGLACFGKTKQAERQRITRPLRLRGGYAPRNSANQERPREEWIEIPVPAIVSETAFELAQERLQENKRLSSRRTVQWSIVQGLVSCSKCGYGMCRTSTRTSARKIHYYRCLGSDSWRHLNGPVCDNRPVRQDLLDQLVWDEVIKLLEDPTLIQHEIEQRLAAARDANPNKRREQSLQLELTRTRKAMERLVTAYQEALISLEELRARIPELRRREQTLQTELKSIADQTNTRAAYLRLSETLTTFLTRLRCSAQTLDIAERQRIVRLLVKDVLVGDDTITIRHSIPISATSAGNDPPPPAGRPSPTDNASCLLRSGCDHAALRRPPFRVTHLAGFHDPRIQPLPNRASDHTVAHPLVQKAPKMTPINVVEKALDVEVDDPATAHLHQSPPQRIQRLVGTPPRPETIRAVQKVLFEHRLQHHQHRTLEHFVL
jgi:site-specific DNA recombinase